MLPSPVLTPDRNGISKKDSTQMLALTNGDNSSKIKIQLDQHVNYKKILAVFVAFSMSDS